MYVCHVHTCMQSCKHACIRPYQPHAPAHASVSIQTRPTERNTEKKGGQTDYPFIHANVLTCMQKARWARACTHTYMHAYIHTCIQTDMYPPTEHREVCLPVDEPFRLPPLRRRLRCGASALATGTILSRCLWRLLRRILGEERFQGRGASEG